MAALTISAAATKLRRERKICLRHEAGTSMATSSGVENPVESYSMTHCEGHRNVLRSTHRIARMPLAEAALVAMMESALTALTTTMAMVTMLGTLL